MKISKFVYSLFSLQIHVITIYRISHFLYYRVPVGGKLFAVAARHLMRVYSSCDISPKAYISKDCKFPHPLGIVIGDGVIIKENVKIWHRVTLGSHGKKGGNQEYPIVERGAKIYNSATIVGPVRLGEFCVIGAHAFVSKSVPDYKTAVGIPARIL